MSAIFLILTFVLFAIAMGFYVTYLFRERKPLSYFDIKENSKNGKPLAKVTWIFWNAAIVCAVGYGVVLLSKFFI